MRKYSRDYGILLLVCLLLFLVTGNRYMLAVFGVQLLFLGILYLVLRAESGKIRIESSMCSTRIVGSDLALQLFVEGKKHFLAAGVVLLHLEIRNTLLDAVEHKELHLTLNEGENRFDLPIDTSLCGGIQITCEKARCYDLFGLLWEKLDEPSEQMCVIYPRKVPVELTKGKRLSAYPGEGYQFLQRGNDYSEILGLREYQPGDDFRSIHWKLSGKMGKMIVREAGNPSHYDTMVLFDAGLHGDGEEYGTEISAAVELGTTISRELLRLHIPHCLGIPSLRGFQVYRIDDGMNVTELAGRWMKISLMERNGMALRHFFMQKLETGYTKIIYITAGKYAPELEQLGAAAQVTAICLQKSGTGVGVAEKDRIQLIQIPVDMLFERKYNIQI